MVFYFFISIVFIAEVIIGLTLFVYLFKADKMVLKYNELVVETRPSIKEVMILVRKISKQLVELSPMITTKIKSLPSSKMNCFICCTSADFIAFSVL